MRRLRRENPARRRWALARNVESALWHVEQDGDDRGWAADLALLAD